MGSEMCIRDRPPIVLLPGVWEPWRFLRPLARSLHAAGHPVHTVADLGWNGVDLDRSADRVVAYLRRADVRGGVLVAHSKGGLIGKKVLLHPGLEERVSGLVAVATPFGGSSLSFGLLARTPLGLFAPAGAAIGALTGERAVNRRIVSVAPASASSAPPAEPQPGQRFPTSGVEKPFITDASRCARWLRKTPSSVSGRPSGPDSGTRQLGYSSMVPGWFWVRRSPTASTRAAVTTRAGDCST